MGTLQDLINAAKKEMGPKVFDQFRRHMAGEDEPTGKPMVPCICDGTGFSDKVDRGATTTEPKELICPDCLGRGWIEN